MKKSILIVGGYGAVGEKICEILSEKYPGKVIIAGRNLSKAVDLSNKLRNKAAPLEFDIYDSSKYNSALKGVHTVISCIETPTLITFFQHCVEAGINYTEIATSFETYKRILEFKGQIHNVAVIPGVGLMPGLSNIMAYDLGKKLDNVSEVGLNLMLGFGEEHGLDAIRWVLENIDSKYEIKMDGKIIAAESFSNPHTTTLLTESRPRTFYQFNFADQHVLKLTLSPRKAISRIAFDSRFLTWIIYLCKKSGVLRFIKNLDPTLLQKFSKIIKDGSDQYAILIEVFGEFQGKEQVLKGMAYGRKEAVATGIIASFIVDKLYNSEIPRGVFHAEEVVSPKDLYNYCKEHGMKIKFLPSIAQRKSS